MNTENHKRVLKMIIAALCFALGYVLPFLTGQIPKIGAMLCPMHIPVLLCGFIAGPWWGLAVGATVPIFRSLTLGAPLFFPKAVCMSFELAAYGAVAGSMHLLLPKKKPYIYLSLLAAMIVGRIIWGAAMLVSTGIKGDTFTFAAFIAGAFVNAIPGIIIQIVLIPILVMILENPKVLNLKVNR